MERATGTEVYGCGSPQSTDITLNIQTTTGGNFTISLNGKNTVEHLKKVVSKKLKVSKDRICLLHRERQLRDGTLEENGLFDGSRVILLPSVETGLLSQRTENSVMQALESLNDNQVNDFLSGKSPLNLTMRLGDHMMLIQLQLSTLNVLPTSSSRSLRTSTPSKQSCSSPVRSTSRNDAQDSPSSSSTLEILTPQSTPEKLTTSDTGTLSDSDCISKSSQHKEPYSMKREELETLCNDFYSSLAENLHDNTQDGREYIENMDTGNDSVSDFSSSLDKEQSPIKSLSNLVSSPINTSTCDNTAHPSPFQNSVVNAVKTSLIDMLSSNLGAKMEPSNLPLNLVTTEKPCDSQFIINPESSSDDSENFPDQSSFLTESTIDEYPMEHLFNSAVDNGFLEKQDDSMMDREISNLATSGCSTDATTPRHLPSIRHFTDPLKTRRFHYILHKPSKFKHPVGQNKQKAFMQSVVDKHKKRMQSRQEHNYAASQPSTSRTEPYSPRKLLLQSSNSNTEEDPQPSTSQQTVPLDLHNSAASKSAPVSPSSPVPDTKALIEASKNLTQTLKKLSKEVLTNKIDLKSAEETMRSKVGPGAVIESMKHHGKGIYSGTFSGTLNPALQDRYGRPKRDISTIIHILNDLLCATPAITLSQKDSKHSCTEESSKCLGCSQPSCSYGHCDGHLPSTSTSAMPGESICICPDKTKDCNCQSRLSPLRTESCPNCSSKSNLGDVCKKCDTAKTLALENSKTKCKLEQLRLVMQQKKQRREARKLKTLPYTSSPPKTIGSPDQNIQEEIETVA